MPYSSQTGILNRPLNTADIATAIGEGSLDVGTLCASARINPFAKYKPIAHDDIGQVNESERSAANHGLSIPEYTTAAELIAESAVWKYRERTRFRMFDFTCPDDNTVGYYHRAPSPILTCPVRGDIVVNSLSELAATGRIPFYAFIKQTNPNNVNDMEVDESIGMAGKYNPSHTEAQLSMSLSVEDLATTPGKNAILTKNRGFRFGVALFEKDSPHTYVKELLCREDFNPWGVMTIGEESYRLANNLSTEEADGDFLAIPFARIGDEDEGYKYIPLQRHPLSSGAVYPCRFNLSTTGASRYTFRYGLVGSTPESLKTSMNTTAKSLLIYVYVSPGEFRHQTTAKTIGDWNLRLDISGSILESGADSPTTISRSSVGTTRVSPDAFTIEPGGTATLIFRLEMLWTADGVNTLTPSVTNPPQGLEIRPTLYFRDAPLSDGNSARSLFVYYAD